MTIITTPQGPCVSREEAWLRAWLAVAGTFNSQVPDCTRYADECLKAFDQRFTRESDK